MARRRRKLRVVVYRKCSKFVHTGRVALRCGAVRAIAARVALRRLVSYKCTLTLARYVAVYCGILQHTVDKIKHVDDDDEP